MQTEWLEQAKWAKSDKGPVGQGQVCSGIVWTIYGQEESRFGPFGFR